MLIEYIWGAVGFATGVCFATMCLTVATILDDRAEERRRRAEAEVAKMREQARHEYDFLDKVRWWKGEQQSKGSKS